MSQPPLSSPPPRSCRHLALPALLTLLAPLAVAPRPLHAGWQEGVAAYQADQLETALAEFQAVTESRPDFAGGHLMVGQVLSRLDRWSEATVSFARAYELEPEPKPGLILPWSRALIEGRQPEKALTLLDRIEPGVLNGDQKLVYHALLSRALTDGEPSARSIERLDRLARGNPDSPVLWQALGHALSRADRPAEAAEAFEHALRLSDDSPASARAYVSAAFDAARTAGDDTRREWYGRAVEAAERLVDREPTIDHWLLLGEARLGALQYREAVAAFDKAAVVAPKDPLPDYYLGEAWLGLEDGARAEWVLRDALHKSPGSDLELRIHTALGRAHHLEKEYLQAAREYRAAGDEERAALMEQYQQLADENDQIDRDRKLCERRLGELEKLMAGSGDLKGTPEWRQLEQDVARLRQACG